jgi:very-short-patch-repair endonuclease
MNTWEGEGDRAALAALDRHDQRRRCGVPTVSVLFGPVEPSLRLARRWAEASGRPMVLVRPEQPDPEIVVVPWVNRLTADGDLATAVAEWLARRLDRPADSLIGSLRAMTTYERKMFLESALPMVSETGVELVGRWLIENAGVWPECPGLARALDSLLEGRGRPYIRVFTALGELVRLECLPVLVFSLATQDLSRMHGIARLLAELAAAQPRPALMLVVEPALFDVYQAQAPVSRAKALLREAVVHFNHGRSAGTEARPSEEDLSSSQCGGPPCPPFGDTDDDPARSAAERFLFERLESSRETAGLFELNGTLDFRFGPTHWIEVDLVARSLRLAVEVDGYHHFQDPEAYRRDRRKDLELQKHGYMVVRVLADDVVERFEDVRNTVLTAVEFRREALIDPEIKP